MSLINKIRFVGKIFSIDSNENKYLEVFTDREVKRRNVKNYFFNFFKVSLLKVNSKINKLNKIFIIKLKKEDYTKIVDKIKIIQE